MSEIKNIKLNGTAFPISGSGGTGGTGKVFEDVTEIPSNPNTETIYRVKEELTPVPNDESNLGTVYFNTELSPQEVVNILNNPDIQWADGALFGNENFHMFTICGFDGSGFDIFGNDTVVGLTVTKGKDGTDYQGVYSINYIGLSTGSTLPVFLNTATEFNGWAKENSSLSLNINGISDFQGFPIGNNNSLITKIVSANNAFNQKAKYYNYDGTKLNEINTKEEYVIEFEYDRNIYPSESEFYDQVIKNYRLPDDLLSKFPDNINVRARITYTNVGTDPVQTIVEEYELQDYWLFPKFGDDLRGAQLNFRYVDAANKTSNTIRLARFAVDGEETISNNFFYNFSLGSSSGSSVTVDTAMSDESTNPVQNKVIKEYVDNAITSAIIAKLMEEY